MIESVNIAFWVQRWSELRPSKPAIIFQDQEITYLQLHHRCQRTAAWLQAIGIEKGDRVAVMVYNCPEFIELYLGCARLGAIFVPINFRLSPPEVDYLLQHCDPKLFVFDQAHAPQPGSLDVTGRMPWMSLAGIDAIDSTAGIIDYNDQVSRFQDRKPEMTEISRAADPEEPQVIMYTSGTTGQPKGAVLSFRKTF